MAAPRLRSRNIVALQDLYACRDGLNLAIRSLEKIQRTLEKGQCIIAKGSTLAVDRYGA